MCPHPLQRIVETLGFPPDHMIAHSTSGGKYFKRLDSLQVTAEVRALAVVGTRPLLTTHKSKQNQVQVAYACIVTTPPPLSRPLPLSLLRLYRHPPVFSPPFTVTFRAVIRGMTKDGYATRNVTKRVTLSTRRGGSPSGQKLPRLANTLGGKKNVYLTTYYTYYTTYYENLLLRLDYVLYDHYT
eukprot:1192074-Prorocentrum_minimum.AAC.5